MQRTRALLAACLLLTLTPAGASGAQLSPDSRWAGIQNDTNGATRASVEFVVPPIDGHCGSGLTSNAAAWLGIGGVYGNAFAQLGVTLAPGSRGAWFELFDHDRNGPVRDIPLDIQVGDRMRLRLAYTDDHATLLLVWRNITTGQRVEHTIDQAQRFYAGNTVEWIVERSRDTLADFGQLTFEDAYYTDTAGLHSLAPADWNETIVYGVDWKHATRTTVDSPTSATVKWLACT